MVKEGAMEYLLGVMDKFLTQLGAEPAEKEGYLSDLGKELSEALNAVKVDTIIETLYALYENDADTLEKDIIDIHALGENLCSIPVFPFERKKALQNILFSAKDLFDPEWSELLGK